MQRNHIHIFKREEMSNTNTGGPAFPGLHPSSECRYKEEGMTLRDYFAAKAMQGLLASTKVTDARIIAIDAYEMADAMLKAREA
jgi:hypothetical protein